MNKLLITRLFESFSELERAIASARRSLEGREGEAEELVERIERYEEILNKQRRFAQDLVLFANRGDWNEVERHVKLINGLSQMIRDDAREVVAGIRPPLTVEERELMLS